MFHRVIRHLYFHIPFCPRLCPYCSFHVETSMRTKNRAFLDALLAEVRLRAAEFPVAPETIYFGGGTPSMLSIGELEYLLGGLRGILPLDAMREWTFEVNPATVSPEKAAHLRQLGVNRISIGVQSWDDGILATLGRVHSAAQAEATYRVLRHAGIENINIDLMFAIPGQTRAQWRDTLRRTVALAPEHVSAYCLTYEEDTRYFEQLQAGEFHRDDERDAAMFEESMDFLGEAGYAHYEISNYARPGRESLHNFGYWNGDDYLGFGPSAFSTAGARRWQNVPDSAAYILRIGAAGAAVSFEETLSEKTRTGETLAFGLRTARGIPAQAAAPWETELLEMRALGLLESRDGTSAPHAPRKIDGRFRGRSLRVTMAAEYDVAIAGGGPAGAVCGTLCAEAGLRTLVLEKSLFPRDKVCGDCLNPGCWPIFERLGVAEAILDSPHASISRVTFIGARGLRVPFPSMPKAAAKLRFHAASSTPSCSLAAARPARKSARKPRCAPWPAMAPAIGASIRRRAISPPAISSLRMAATRPSPACSALRPPRAATASGSRPTFPRPPGSMVESSCTCSRTAIAAPPPLATASPISVSSPPRTASTRSRPPSQPVSPFHPRGNGAPSPH